LTWRVYGNAVGHRVFQQEERDFTPIASRKPAIRVG
jgi:hypothetical protein